jgi:hypothetical protein
MNDLASLLPLTGSGQGADLLVNENLDPSIPIALLRERKQRQSENASHGRTAG